MPSFPLDGETLVTPDRLPVLPLRDVVLFPYVAMPLLVGRPASLAALDAATDADRLVLLVAQRDAEMQEPAAADLLPRRRDRARAAGQPRLRATAR